MNINRDYLVKIFLAKAGSSRGKIEASNILFYTSDRHTQSLFLVSDVDISGLDKIELLFAIGGNKYRITGTVLDTKTVLFDLDYHDLQIVGTYEAIVKLHKGADILTSDPFTFRVKANLLRGDDINES